MVLKVVQPETSPLDISFLFSCIDYILLIILLRDKFTPSASGCVILSCSEKILQQKIKMAQLQAAISHLPSYVDSF